MTIPSKEADDVTPEMLNEALIRKCLNGEFNRDQQVIAETCREFTATLLKKNIDYGSSVFQRPVLAPDMPADSAILVRATDKVQRLRNLLKKLDEVVDVIPQVKDESIEDTIRDLGAYCLLWLCYQRISNGKSESFNSGDLAASMHRGSAGA